jgi:hypothetical protein
VLNTSFGDPVRAPLAVDGLRVVGGRVHEIAPANPRAYVDRNHPHAFRPVEKPLTGGRELVWSFPARSVSAVELDVEVRA